jgi:hypothetical protein
MKKKTKRATRRDIDPRSVFTDIASDPTAPASARVMAARALQAGEKGRKPTRADDLSERAIQTADPDSDIPIVETYRGVGIHDCQSANRVEDVKRAIDVVHEMFDIAGLVEFAADVSNPPEARLLAAAKAKSAWDLAADSREVRPEIELDRLRASTAGLGWVEWRDPEHYCSLLEGHARAVRRERPLGD